MNLKAIKYATIAMPDMYYDESIQLEKELSSWFEWQEPENRLKTTLETHSLHFTLTGDSQKLIEEYERTQ